jgi:hypothetical protein
MATNTKHPPQKVRMTISLTKQAQDIIFDHGYASARTVGDFISQLIVAHHARVSRKPAPKEIAAELRRLVDVLEQQ